MAILRQLDIKGFKSIWQDCLDLGQLNVFIGTNGAGKSNLLEAIAMLSASLEGGIDYERLQHRGARLSSSAIFRSAFKNKNRTSIFRLEAHFDNDLSYSMSVNAVEGFRYHSESIKVDGATIAGRSNNGATINGISLNSKLDNRKAIFPYLQALKTIQNNINYSQEIETLSALTRYAIYAPATPLLRGTETDSSAKEPLGLYGGRLADALNEVLNDKEARPQIQRFFELINWVKSVGTTKQVNQELVSGHINLIGAKVVYSDKYMITNFNKLYGYDVSEGALYILFALVLLIHKNSPNIFALDNVDNALNPGLIRALMSQISEILEKNPEKQVFLTTHNPAALDAVDLFNPKHRLFVVERDEDGHTKFRRISPPSNMTKDEWEEQYFGMKLSEIWMSGAIGGMPAGF